MPGQRPAVRSMIFLGMQGEPAAPSGAIFGAGTPSLSGHRSADWGRHRNHLDGHVELEGTELSEAIKAVHAGLTCRLCRRLIPLAQDIYELDAEWQRRFPDMVGTLACHDRALRTDWTCTRNGSYVDGHISVDSPVLYIDA